MLKQAKWVKWLFLSLGMLFAIVVGFGLGGWYTTTEKGSLLPHFTAKISEEQQKVIDAETIRQAELSLIRLDLNEYEFLSTRVKDDIAEQIGETSSRYKLPPALLHAIFQIESDYRFNIDHPTVKVKIKGQIVTTNCRGLGGILWEVWREDLRKEGIAETSSDLYLPRVNVAATGYILRTIINDELSKGRDGWIVRRIIAQYYGATSPQYEAKMRTVTSNLWLKRIAREIETLHVVPLEAAIADTTVTKNK